MTHYKLIIIRENIDFIILINFIIISEERLNILSNLGLKKYI